MVEAFGMTDSGCVRTNNEDCFLLADDIGLFVVADGMGGAQAGEHASRLAASFVVDRMRKAQRRDTGSLVESIQEANLAVMSAAAGVSQLEGMGTTLVAALAKDGVAAIASVGDSRAYLFDSGRLSEVTEDQTWVNEVGRKLGMDESALRTHPMRHVLTMAVGVSQPLKVNTYEVPLAPGNLLLLCSDGLHGVVSEAVIEEALSNHSKSLAAKCEYLIESARAAGGPDNITTVVLRAT
jgi:serine/threonine protein phosphatase PrpC